MPATSADWSIMRAKDLSEQFFWPRAAACKDADPGLFFPGLHQSAVPALTICATCTVKQHCLEVGMELGDAYGIWGGLTASALRRLARRGA